MDIEAVAKRIAERLVAELGYGLHSIRDNARASVADVVAAELTKALKPVTATWEWAYLQLTAGHRVRGSDWPDTSFLELHPYEQDRGRSIVLTNINGRYPYTMWTDDFENTFWQFATESTSQSAEPEPQQGPPE